MMQVSRSSKGPEISDDDSNARRGTPVIFEKFGIFNGAILSKLSPQTHRREFFDQCDFKVGNDLLNWSTRVQHNMAWWKTESSTAEFDGFAAGNYRLCKPWLYSKERD
jgi:hypothetical protein